MRFIVTTQMPQTYEANTFYLLKGSIHKGRLDDTWNDYGFHTGYTLQYCDATKTVQQIGTVNIGEVGMDDNQQSPCLPSEFTKLSNRFFSIGYDEYYKKIASLKNDIGYDILIALNDITLDRGLLEEVMNEPVLSSSLLRGIPSSKHEEHLNSFYKLLAPPINLGTMRRIFGSTNWETADNGLLEMQKLLLQANTHLYYNAIATIGREIIHQLANDIYDDELHRDKSKYPNAPKKDQYINKLHGFVDYCYAEETITENVKNNIKATIELVNGYVHKEGAEHFECYLCVHSVISLVFQLSIICQKERYNDLTP